MTFIVDADGAKDLAGNLKSSGRWLWFRPDVITGLAHRRGGGLSWYTRDTGAVWCVSGYSVHFGVNPLGFVNVYAKDIALLPEWQQRIWAGYNVSPEGGVSEELLASQVKASPADTKAPEAFLPQGLQLLNTLSLETLGFALFRDHEGARELLNRAHRFRVLDASGLFSLAKDLIRLTADAINTEAIQKTTPPPKGSKPSSLKSLENMLAKKSNPTVARKVMGPLFGIYELRLADAHMPSSEIDKTLALVGIDKSSPPVIQGYMLLHACVSTLYRIEKILKDSSAGRS